MDTINFSSIVSIKKSIHELKLKHEEHAKRKYFFDIKLHRNKSENTRFSSAIKIKLFLFIIETLAFSH